MTASANRPAKKVTLWKSDPKRDAVFDRRLEKDVKLNEMCDLMARNRAGEELTDKEKARARKLRAEAWAWRLA